MNDVLNNEVKGKLFPDPMYNYVVIRNPLYKMQEELQEKMKKLPAKEKEEFIRSTSKKFSAVEVLAVGPGVTHQNLIPGAKIMTTMIQVSNALGYGEEFIYMRENEFVAIW